MKFLYLRTHYWFSLKAGGSVGHTAGVINALKNKVNLEILSNDTLAEVDHPITLVKPIFIPWLPNDLNELIYNAKIIRYCEEIDIDTIYQRHSAFSFSGAYLAKKKEIPFILEFNSSDVWKLRYWSSNNNLLRKIYRSIIKLPLASFIENYNINYASYIVVVSQVLSDFLVGKGVDSKKIIVMPNGVDEKKYQPNIDCTEIKKRYDLKNKVVVGFIGTFGVWHGVENIVIAYGELLKRFPKYITNTNLLLIGDGIKMIEVKKQIDEYSLIKNVILTGIVPQSDGAKHLAACDILVNSTIENPDGSVFFGSPTKLFEYMAMGKGIICSDMAQMSDVLDHKRTAYMVQPGNKEELILGLKALIDNQYMREELGRNARAEVIKKYTWDKQIDKVLEKIKNDKL